MNKVLIIALTSILFIGCSEPTKTSSPAVTTETETTSEQTSAESRVVNIEETKKIMSLSAEMVNKKPFYVLVDARDILASVDHNSRKYMAEHEVNKHNMAQAMVVNNMPIRIIANFYLKFYKHAYPMKIFTDISKAREWLLQQVNPY